MEGIKAVAKRGIRVPNAGSTGGILMIQNRSGAVAEFRRVAKEDPRVLAGFLGGSLATGNADRFSDIDVYFIVDPRSYARFRSEVPSLLGKTGPLVFLEEHSNFGFDLVLFIFRNGVNGELGLGTPKNFKTMHAGPFKVLADKKGLLEKAEFPYGKPLAGEALQKQVQKSLAWYWYLYGVFLKSVARGHLWSATANLSEMRKQTWTLLQQAYRVRSVEKSKSRLPPKLRATLGRTLPNYSRKSFLSSANLLTRILKKELHGLLVSTRVRYPDELEQTILAKFRPN